MAKKPSRAAARPARKSSAVKSQKSPESGKSSARSTMSGPSAKAGRFDPKDAAQRKMAATGELAESFPENPNKAGEYGDAAREPDEGVHVAPRDPAATGSTLTEVNPSPKVGSGAPPSGFNAGNGPLDRVRADSGNRTLTTNQGVPVADNQNSLKAGLRGPALLEDFILREKITHFDHERIPERIVHARVIFARGL
jgi:catalase